MDDKMKVFLNKLVSYLFDVKDDREKSVEIIDILIDNLNYIIKTTNHYKKEFNKKEWFIYINLTRYCMDNNINFKELVDSIDMDSIFNEIRYIQEPSPAHFKTFSKIIKGVQSSVV
jgi:hypothetical protein